MSIRRTPSTTAASPSLAAVLAAGMQRGQQRQPDVPVGMMAGEAPKKMENNTFFNMFFDSFKLNDDGRFNTTTTDPAVETKVEELLSDENVFVVKFAGKNGVDDEDKLPLKGVVDTVVPKTFAYMESLGKTRALLVSEGDNLENNVDKKYSPFSDAQLRFLNMCIQKGVEVHFLLIKEKVGANGASSDFAKVWQDELAKINMQGRTYFGINANYSMLTFDLAQVIPFIGTTMKPKYMTKVENGEIVNTTGYKHLLALKNNPGLTAKVSSDKLVTFYRSSSKVPLVRHVPQTWNGAWSMNLYS